MPVNARATHDEAPVIIGSRTSGMDTTLGELMQDRRTRELMLMEAWGERVANGSMSMADYGAKVRALVVKESR